MQTEYFVCALTQNIAHNGGIVACIVVSLGYVYASVLFQLIHYIMHKQEAERSCLLSVYVYQVSMQPYHKKKYWLQLH